MPFALQFILRLLPAIVLGVGCWPHSNSIGKGGWLKRLSLAKTTVFFENKSKARKSYTKQKDKKNPAPGGGAGLRPIGVKYAVHDPRYLDHRSDPTNVSSHIWGEVSNISNVIIA